MIQKPSLCHEKNQISLLPTVLFPRRVFLQITGKTRTKLGDMFGLNAAWCSDCVPKATTCSPGVKELSCCAHWGVNRRTTVNTHTLPFLTQQQSSLLLHTDAERAADSKPSPLPEVWRHRRQSMAQPGRINDALNADFYLFIYWGATTHFRVLAVSAPLRSASSTPPTMSRRAGCLLF